MHGGRAQLISLIHRNNNGEQNSCHKRILSNEMVALPAGEECASAT